MYRLILYLSHNTACKLHFEIYMSKCNYDTFCVWKFYLRRLQNKLLNYASLFMLSARSRDGDSVITRCRKSRFDIHLVKGC